MKTETVKMALYKDSRYTWSENFASTSKYMDAVPHYIRTSDYVDVEFMAINDAAEKDALKGHAIKAARKAVDDAQKTLDALL